MVLFYIILILVVSLVLVLSLIALTHRREKPDPQADLEAARALAQDQYRNASYTWDGRNYPHP